MKQGNKTKNLILDASNELFYKNGYASTSFSDIVNSTGLSKGNITYHFKNKQNILEAIIENRLTDINKLLLLWEKSTDDPKKRLILFCEMIIQEQNNLKNFGCPMGTLTSEFSKNQPELYNITIPLFKRFREWLKEQFYLLGLSEKKADERAMSLLAYVQGISTITHVFKDLNFLNQEMDKLKKSICS